MSVLAALTDYSVNDTEQFMSVKTEKLFPIQSSAHRHTFRLEPSAGSFLDKNTLLMFKPVAASQAASDAGLRLNCWSGALGCISRIQLNVGDNNIEDISGLPLWSAMNSLYNQSPDEQEKKFPHYIGNCLKYDYNAASGGAALGGDSSMTGQLIVDSAASGINYGNLTTGAGAAVLNNKITNVAADNTRMAIPIGMILNSIKNDRLPLFLFQDYRINIVVDFETDASRYCNRMDKNNYASATGSLAAEQADIVFQEVEMLVDYLVYPSSVQNSYEEAVRKEGGYNFEFVNVNHIQKSVGAATANTTQIVEHRLNLQNAEMHYIQQFKSLPAVPYVAAAAGVNAVQGPFSDKVLLNQRSNSVSLQKVQFNVNGIDVFPAPQGNPLANYNQLAYVLGKDVQVPKPLYVNDSNAEYSMLTNSASSIKGKYNVLAFDSRNGESSIRGGGTPVGNYPVICRYERRPHAAINKVDYVASPGADPSDIELGCDDRGILDMDYFVGATRLVNVRRLPSGGNSVVVLD